MDTSANSLPPGAQDLLIEAADTISNRAAERDNQAERSMARTVAIYNALAGDEVLTERDGWMFMVCLKMARAAQGQHRLDDYVDGAAYFALAGECAAFDANPPF